MVNGLRPRRARPSLQAVQLPLVRILSAKIKLPRVFLRTRMDSLQYFWLP